MSREALIKICIASDVKWSDKNTEYEIRKLIMDRQNRTTKTSKYIFMSLSELKQSAKRVRSWVQWDKTRHYESHS